MSVRTQESILRVNHARTGSGTFRPQLTSLIDVMTILLVFLIKSFSAEGNLITPSADLTLPVSTSNEQPAPTPTVSVSNDAVLWEGETVARLDEYGARDSLLIPALHEAMTRFRTSLGSNSERILIQADRELPFESVKRVMYSCSKAGFSDFEILVMEEG